MRALTSSGWHDFGWQAADCDDGYSTLAPVGRLKPNGFGLYDVAGYSESFQAASP